MRAISFVGSTPVAKYVYDAAGENGKRAQCQGGAKNHVIVLPDADMKMATQIISDSAFGCAGQRCLAVSVAVTIGEAQKTFRDAIAESAANLRVGNGLDEGMQMGPVISEQSKARIESLIAAGEKQGAKVLIDGRNPKIPKYEAGNFVKPTILDDVSPTSEVADTEIFGPVLSLIHARDLDEALAFLERSKYRQSGFVVYFERRSGAAIPLRSPRRQYRNQHRRGRAHGLLSRSADGKTASSASCMGRAATPSSSIPKRKWW